MGTGPQVDPSWSRPSCSEATCHILSRSQRGWKNAHPTQPHWNSWHLTPYAFLILSLYFPCTFLCDFVDLDNAFVLDSDPHMPTAGASPQPTVSGVVARRPPWGHDAAVLVFPLSTSTWKMPPWLIYAISIPQNSISSVKSCKNDHSCFPCSSCEKSLPQHNCSQGGYSTLSQHSGQLLPTRSCASDNSTKLRMVASPIQQPDSSTDLIPKVESFENLFMLDVYTSEGRRTGSRCFLLIFWVWVHNLLVTDNF